MVINAIIGKDDILVIATPIKSRRKCHVCLNRRVIRILPQIRGVSAIKVLCSCMIIRVVDPKEFIEANKKE